MGLRQFIHSVFLCGVLHHGIAAWLRSVGNQVSDQHFVLLCVKTHDILTGDNAAFDPVPVIVSENLYTHIKSQ